MRRAKIVATLGPATSDQRVVDELVQCGVDEARLNFSHGSREEHRKRIEAIRSACQHLG